MIRMTPTARLIAFCYTAAVIVLLSSYKHQGLGNFRRQGIEGHIYFVSGNRMPTVGVQLPAPQPMRTTLYIYELTNLSQVKKEGESSFYKTINTNLVKVVTSNKKGRYKVKLPPGTYSLFVKKDDLFYANIFDGQNNIHPITVEEGKMTNVDINVDWDAVY